jgi:hypothetical protein
MGRVPGVGMDGGVQGAFGAMESLEVALMAGVAASALRTGSAMLFNRIFNHSGMLFSSLKWLRESDHRSWLPSVLTFYAWVAKRRVAAAQKGPTDVALWILEELFESDEMRRALVRLFRYVACEVLYRNAYWKACEGDRCVSEILRDEFCVEDARVLHFMAELAADERCVFPSCLYSKLAAVMGITFRIVSDRGNSGHVCSDSTHVDVLLARVGEGRFALLVPSQNSVELSAAEADARRMLCLGRKPIIPKRISSLEFPQRESAALAAERARTAALTEELARVRSRLENTDKK